MITLWPLPSATISAVKIRAVALGLDLPAPEVAAAPFETAGRFLSNAKAAFAQVGLEVQTTRAAGAELTHFTDLQAWAAETESAARAAGIDYLSLGRLPASAHHIVAEQVAPFASMLPPFPNRGSPRSADLGGLYCLAGHTSVCG